MAPSDIAVGSLAELGQVAEALGGGAGLDARLGVSFARDDGAPLRPGAAICDIVGPAIATTTYAAVAAKPAAADVCWEPHGTLAEAVADDPRRVAADPLSPPPSTRRRLSRRQIPLGGSCVAGAGTRLGPALRRVFPRRPRPGAGRVHDAGIVAGAT